MAELPWSSLTSRYCADPTGEGEGTGTSVVLKRSIHEPLAVCPHKNKAIMT